MSGPRTATAVSPLFLRAAIRFQRSRPNHLLPRHNPAVAILIPRKAYASHSSTSTESSNSQHNYPPPGFNPDQAKRPLPPQQQEGRQKSAQEAEANEAEAQGEAQVSPDRTASDSKSTAVSGTGLRPEHTSPAAKPKDSVADAKTDVEEQRTLSELAAEKVAADKQGEKKVEKKKEEDKKLTIWQKVKKEAAHYWDGTKLLATEAKISFKLALKMAGGYELTRREHRQFHRTVQDLGRLVPFSVFVIVPFAELLLPVALRLFPNMLPSTYEGQKSKDRKAAALRSARKDVSGFLRQTLKETGLPVTAANAQTEEFTEFFRKVRTTGEKPTTSDVIKVCKIFKDDLTLDNLSRPQLVGICRYMNLNTFGTDAMLRYQVRHRMRQIKRDDKAISFEGVESLSVPELQTAAASRGLRTQGVSPGRLRDDLQMWLDLRLRYGVPSTLLVLSNAFNYAQGKDTELNGQIDALVSVLASVPEELFHEIELEVHNAEGAATNKQRLEVLKEQQELIEEEGQQNEGNEKEGRPVPKDDEDIDEKEGETEADKEEKVVEAVEKEKKA